MPDLALASPELVKWVRSALAHLYDQSFLQNHPLAVMLEQDKNLGQQNRGQRVRRLLLDCIASLQPPPSAPADETRAYAILENHYIDGLTMPAIADKLGLSQRQAYREHDKAIKAVANLMADRIGAGRPPSPNPPKPAELDRLQIAQQEAGRMGGAVRPEALDLADLLAKIATLLEPLRIQTGVPIELSAAENWPAVVADRTMLRQALLNLLTHALRVVRGPIVVTVERAADGWRIDLNAPPVRSPVSDAPTGIPAPSNVGLTVAQSLVQAQGGRLTVENADRWHAQISLPLLQRTVVLAIDDNADIVSLFQRYLGEYAVSVVGVKQAEEALRLAADLEPAVITLDIMMPDQDGWELLQKLKASPAARNVPVVICSVLFEPQLAEAMGASGYLTKPVTQEQLVATLGRWLELRRDAT